MTLGSKGYVQKSRYFFNSQFKNGQPDPLFHLSKTDAKRHFLQGMSFANKVDGRSKVMGRRQLLVYHVTQSQASVSKRALPAVKEQNFQSVEPWNHHLKNNDFRETDELISSILF